MRSWMFSHAIAHRHAARCELVGLCDRNEGRLRQREAWARVNGLDAPGYPAEGYERMLRERRPDAVVVTTEDRDHAPLVVRALELGCDAVCEKPLATDAAGLRAILSAERRTGRRVTVTFNYRYAPPREQVKALLDAGTVGEVLAVDFHWLLDTTHGADYFRRWHREKARSGGLLVHKASHHFDLVNWWIGSVPERVFATGGRRYYVPEQAERLGLAGRGERCLDCAVSARCPFHLDLRATGWLRAVYLDHEGFDGYQRDRCVFSEAIDIEDTAHVAAEYASGARMSYSLHAMSPWEGYVVAFTGTKGRLEHVCEESVYVSGDGSVPGALRPRGTTIRVDPHFTPAYAVEPEEAAGGHGGGDERLLDALLGPPAPDPLGRAADHRAGAWAALTGVAANRSLETGEAVRPLELVPELGGG